MNNLEFFLNLGPNKINAILIDKINKNKIFNKDFDFENNFNDAKVVINNLNKILKNLIIEVEKKINNPINMVNLMIDNPETLSIYISVKKNFDNKKIYKNQIEYLIEDLKQQILKNSSDIKIGHILVEYYFLDGEMYNKLPIGETCKDLVIQTRFICFSKVYTDSLEDLFFNYQIDINKIICTNYAKSLLENDLIDNFGEAGLRVVDGFNTKEVDLNSKKMIKVGFFEKLFHIFS
tara:strand:- start:169 stop:873 length:705 start_codon:yes stop_codon:yes gene_type:complete